MIKQALLCAAAWGIRAEQQQRHGGAMQDSSGGIGGTVSYQAHSYNDLREWPQLFAKGTLFLKIDPQYAPSIICETVAGSRVAGYPGHVSPAGCLLLNHDDVSILRQGYNTTDDVVAFVSDPAHAAFFRDPAPGARKHISLCFKGCGGPSCPCDGDSSGLTRDWLSLVDDLFQKLNAAVASNGLNLEILLDGSGNVGPSCLADRWRPWNSMYISGGDPDEAFFDNTRNASVGWDRLAVLNEPEDQWAYAVDHAFGKFVHGSYPYVLWEPSDQASILKYADAYISTGQAHGAGMRFAINIDPAQWETYAGSRTGRAWDAVLVPANVTGAGGASLALPTMTVLRMPTGQQGYAHVAVHLWQVVAGPSAALHYSITAFDGVGDPPAPLGTGALPPPGIAPTGDGQPVSAAPVVVGGTAYVAVAATSVGTGTVSAALYAVQASGSAASLSWTAGVQFPRAFPPSTAAAASCVLACGPEGTDTCTATVYAPAPGTGGGCALFLSLRTWNGSSVLPAPACIVAEGAALGPISPGNLSVAGVGYSNASTGAPLVAVAVVYSDAHATVYGAAACVDVRASAVSALNDPTCGAGLADLEAPRPAHALAGTSQPLPLWVGSRPQVALLASPAPGGGVAVLSVHGSGYCANAEAHNKDANTGLCDQPPVANSGGAYLNYAYGGLAGWTEALLLAAAQTAASESGPAAAAAGVSYGASPCSLTFAAGMWGMGAGPSPALWHDASTGAVAGGVAYEGLGRAVADPLSCGLALPSPGDLRLGGWPLAQRFFGAA